MTALIEPVSSGSAEAGADVVRKADTRRAQVAGIAYLATATAIVTLFGFGSGAGLSSSFGLAPSGDDPYFWTVPSRGTALAVAGVCAMLGGVQLARGFKRRGLVTVLVVVLFAFAFLVWAARGDDFSLVGMLQSTVTRSIPLALGALAGILCERSGVVNIAIEGMMLFSAFAGAFVGSLFGNLWAGLVAGMLAGALLASVHASLSIKYQVDQIISGTAINIFALGITSYLAARISRENPDLNNPGTFDLWTIPVLGDIPLVGPVLFRGNIYVYLMLVLIPLVTFALFRTRWGLRTRSVGEHPKAADTVGINVLRVRYRNVMLGGAVAGIAGSYLTLGSVGGFEQNMTAGRGFIALAAMIFGRWNPVGALGAALLFGFAESLQTKLVGLDTPIPSEFLLMAPYVLTLLVVAGFVGKSRAPASVGLPYRKG